MNMKYDNTSVRRQDRLLDEDTARMILKNGEYGCLSMVMEDGTPYGIPISYVWDGGGSVYLHCAPEGLKLRCLAHQPVVSFCVVGKTNVIPRQFTTEYQSIVLKCRAVTGLEEAERMNALKLLITKYAPDDVQLGLTYAKKSFSRTNIVRLDIVCWSGKSKAVHK